MYQKNPNQQATDLISFVKLNNYSLYSSKHPGKNRNVSLLNSVPKSFCPFEREQTVLSMFTNQVTESTNKGTLPRNETLGSSKEINCFVLTKNTTIFKIG